MANGIHGARRPSAGTSTPGKRVATRRTTSGDRHRGDRSSRIVSVSPANPQSSGKLSGSGTNHVSCASGLVIARPRYPDAARGYIRRVSAAIAERAAEHGRVAIDTEFVSERRYQAQLCLVSVAVPDADGPDGVHTEVLDPLDESSGLDPAPAGARARRPRRRGAGARGPPGRGHPAPDLEHRRHPRLRHAGGRGLPGLRQPGGLRVAGQARAGRAPERRRGLHALGQAAAHRRRRSTTPPTMPAACSRSATRWSAI